jgi:hypothetical protein
MSGPAARWSFPPLSYWAAGGLAVVAVPFTVAGIYRVAPAGLPTSVPFLLLLALAVPALVKQGVSRAVGAGVLIGAGIYGVFLLWLLMILGRGMERFGS